MSWSWIIKVRNQDHYRSTSTHRYNLLQALTFLDAHRSVLRGIRWFPERGRRNGIGCRHHVWESQDLRRSCRASGTSDAIKNVGARWHHCTEEKRYIM